MPEQSNSNGSTSSKGVCVKLSLKDYLSIKTLSQRLGKSVPSLLRECFFNGTDRRPLMDNESAKKFLVEINRIGNNINQIAKKVNSGIQYGWSMHLEQCVYELTKMREILGGQYGN